MLLASWILNRGGLSFHLWLTQHSWYCSQGEHILSTVTEALCARATSGAPSPLVCSPPFLKALSRLVQKLPMGQAAPVLRMVARDEGTLLEALASGGAACGCILRCTAVFHDLSSEKSRVGAVKSKCNFLNKPLEVSHQRGSVARWPSSSILHIRPSFSEQYDLRRVTRRLLHVGKRAVKNDQKSLKDR